MLNDFFDKMQGYKTYTFNLEENIDIQFKSKINRFDRHMALLKNILIFVETYTFDTELYLPKNWYVVSFNGSRESGSVDFKSEKIWIKPLKTMENVFTLWHEIGHLKDYSQNSRLLYKDDERNHKLIWLQSDKELKLKGVREYLEREYFAWDFAFEILDKFETSPQLNDRLLKYSEKCLLSHIDSFNYSTLFHNTTYEHRDELIKDLDKWKGNYHVIENNI